MTFGHPLPWWALILVVITAALLAHAAYARAAGLLTPRQRGALVTLRLLTLLLLVAFLMRPMLVRPAESLSDAIVPIVVDGSRSMRIADVGGRSRIEHAGELVRRQVLPALGEQFQIELLTFGETLTPADSRHLAADGRRSDLTAALQAARERYRGRTIAGIVLISDGGDTGGEDLPAGGLPVYPLGVGAPQAVPDREVLSVTVGEPGLIEAAVDLSVSVVSHGFAAKPFDLRVLQNGQLIQARSVTPPGDGVPMREVFQVSPGREGPTLYTVEISTDPAELVPENNSRSVLVRPPGRARRLLMLEGAPGHEHSFLKRALAQDVGLEIDSVVRKGQNDRGQDTFYVRAAAARANALSQGFPATREALFAYDGVVLANIEGDFFSRQQLALLADFVGERGGGVLLFGGRSFAGRSLVGTPLEEVLPLDLTGRGGEVIRTASPASGSLHKLAVTPDGRRHPIMQIASTDDETSRRWAEAPALAASAPLGGPRPGASVLAVVPTAGGIMRPVVAVQRYGRGRAMIFAGEASWRWRMMLPVENRTHEMFWRQAVRWVSTSAPEAISVTTSGGTVPGDPLDVQVAVRDAAFRPLSDASVVARITAPGGQTRELRVPISEGGSGLYIGRHRPEQPGVHHVEVEVRQGTALLDTAEHWMLVGGADLEMADPRQNDELLRRIAAATGGQMLTEADLPALPGLLASNASGLVAETVREVWHGPWSFALIAGLLIGEWVLRRRWGLR
jgi:uncharacterized membrane protein